MKGWKALWHKYQALKCGAVLCCLPEAKENKFHLGLKIIASHEVSGTYCILQEIKSKNGK